MLADVMLAEPTEEASEGTMWLHPDGMIGIVPLPGGVWRIFAELPRGDPLAQGGRTAATALTNTSPVSEAVLDRARVLLRERAGDAAPSIACGTWTSVFQFHRRIASACRRDRFFLAGDAAHIHSALGGQGMNTGIGDAFNLGWKLACVITGGASEKLLDTYEAERRPVAADVVRQTSRAWNLLIGRTVFDRLLRDHALLPILRWPAMQQRWLETGSQLRVSYRGGPLAPTTFGDRLRRFVVHMPLAGDRAPNAACRTVPGGKATTLGALIGADWGLLLFGGAAADQQACATAAQRHLDPLQVIAVEPGSEGRAGSPRARATGRVVQDHEGAVARAYSPGRCSAILLRPDGHIAWRSSRLSPDGLVAWCAANGMHRPAPGFDSVDRTAVSAEPFAGR